MQVFYIICKFFSPLEELSLILLQPQKAAAGKLLIPLGSFTRTTLSQLTHVTSKPSVSAPNRRTLLAVILKEDRIY